MRGGCGGGAARLRLRLHRPHVLMAIVGEGTAPLALKPTSLGHRGEKALPAFVRLAPALGLIAMVLGETLVEVLLHCPLQVQSAGRGGRDPRITSAPHAHPAPFVRLRTHT
jgi:hypothetical protein